MTVFEDLLGDEWERSSDSSSGESDDRWHTLRRLCYEKTTNEDGGIADDEDRRLSLFASLLGRTVLTQSSGKFTNVRPKQSNREIS